MFNEACRLATEEDLERSLELLGVDLSMMSLYVHIAHNCASRAWFWVETPAKRGVANAATRAYFADGTPKAAGEWQHVQAFEGFRQGGPYSCVLAALALVTLLKQARSAMNRASNVPGLPNAPTPDQRVEHWRA
eukprot:SAG11_NODE_7152_length_1186_cov_1.117755_1_plen_133_part_01